MAAQKKNRLGLAPEAARFKDLRHKNDCKIIITRSAENTSPTLPWKEVPPVSGMELVFVTIGICWTVSMFFRVVEAIDR